MVDAARDVAERDFRVHCKRRASREGCGQGQRESKNNQAATRD